MPGMDNSTRDVGYILTLGIDSSSSQLEACPTQVLPWYTNM